MQRNKKKYKARPIPREKVINRTVLEKAHMLDLLDKDFKLDISYMFKELKKLKN